jgi:phosphoglucosamine mutase
LLLLRAMKERGNTLSELTASLEHYPQVLLNVKVREKVPFAEIPGLAAVVSATESSLGKTGRLLLRYSGTELLARIMIEGQNQSEINRYASDIAEVIKNQIGA